MTRAERESLVCAQVRDACCLALRRLVERDQQGDMSLAAAKLICQEVKARRLVAPEEVRRRHMVVVLN